MWYREAKRENWARFFAAIPIAFLFALGAMHHWPTNDVDKLKENIVNTYETPDEALSDIQRSTPQSSESTISTQDRPGPSSAPLANPATIDVYKIVQIESSGNPRARNRRSGARGLMQIMEGTWNEMVNRLGYDWSFDEAYDPEKNMTIGNYYINTEIPRLLSHFGIPDTVKNRLGAYNWGVGNLKRVYDRHGDDWDNYAPRETQDYIKKYGS